MQFHHRGARSLGLGPVDLNLVVALGACHSQPGSYHKEEKERGLQKALLGRVEKRAAFVLLRAATRFILQSTTASEGSERNLSKWYTHKGSAPAKQNQRKRALSIVIEGRRSLGSRRLVRCGFGIQCLWFCCSACIFNRLRFPCPGTRNGQQLSTRRARWMPSAARYSPG